MTDTARTVAGHLLQSKAIILEPSKPFTWASGWISPVYCDNRITLSYPRIRDYIRDTFVDTILREFGEPGLIAGVATGAIAQGALVADRMGLPFAYVRPSAKDHGRQNLVEGRITPGDRVVVVEDLVSTGGSSLRAVGAIRELGARVLGMAAIFSYGFGTAAEQFDEAGVELVTLTDYETMVGMAIETGYITGKEAEILQQWRKDPAGWNKK
ncbi:MAG: orotate phosphoribosyltransferase [Bacteroidetes bacterium]|nr:MAG: orotate phosphoribosyltransferase [Bacteroidota bacterium]